MLAALSLAPLVVITWADGGVDDKERGLLFSWAAEMDLSKADPACRLFERWLAEPPNPKLLTTWKTDYVDALSLVLSREAKHELRIEILNRVQALVEMTGPFSGIGQMLSRAEQAIIDEVDCALS